MITSRTEIVTAALQSLVMISNFRSWSSESVTKLPPHWFYWALGLVKTVNYLFLTEVEKALWANSYLFVWSEVMHLLRLDGDKPRGVDEGMEHSLAAMSLPPISLTHPNCHFRESLPEKLVNFIFYRGHSPFFPQKMFLL